ncbi:hypothetical protein [Streptomyces sp. YGL11-2]|uniref:hypothetical protein n=1 Tax=Streptomyces sp. YGL11-2 TaxID=3414028 RepID=UPI003CE9C7BC
MNARKSIALAAATLALGAGLAATAPSAQAAQSAVPVRAQGWHLLFSDTHTPAFGWRTKDFVPDVNNLGVNFGCYGEDGQRIAADIVRTSDGNVMASSPHHYCQGGHQWEVDAGNVRAGTSYYVHLYQTGLHKHSMYVRAYDYH